MVNKMNFEQYTEETIAFYVAIVWFCGWLLSMLLYFILEKDEIHKSDYDWLGVGLYMVLWPAFLIIALFLVPVITIYWISKKITKQ